MYDPRAVVVDPQAKTMLPEYLCVDVVMERIARVFVGLGVRKLRLTGGEPLLRRKIERLVEMLRALGDDLDITLTTNGALLARKARD